MVNRIRYVREPYPVGGWTANGLHPATVARSGASFPAPSPRTQESFVHQMRLLGTLAGLVGAASVASAQQKATLAKPSAETTESFTNISAIRELPNGKVLLVDRQDKVVQLIDFAGGSVTKVGREGNGP